MGEVGKTYRLADGEFIPGDILESKRNFLYTFVSLKKSQSGEFESAALSPHFMNVENMTFLNPDSRFTIVSRFTLEISQQ